MALSAREGLEKARERRYWENCRLESRGFAETNDCTVKSLSISTGIPYPAAHKLLKDRGRRTRRGTHMHKVEDVLKSIGFKFERVNSAEVYRRFGRTVRTFERDIARMPTRFGILGVSGHVAAFRDGEVWDWSKGGLRRITRVWFLEEDHAFSASLLKRGGGRAGLIRWMGAHGWSFEFTAKVLDGFHWAEGVKDSTIKTYLSDGRSGKWGKVPELSFADEVFLFRHYAKAGEHWPAHDHAHMRNSRETAEFERVESS